MGCMGLWPMDSSYIGTTIPLNANIPHIVARAARWVLGGRGLLTQERTANCCILYKLSAVLGLWTKPAQVSGCSSVAADELFLIPGHLLPGGEMG